MAKWDDNFEKDHPYLSEIVINNRLKNYVYNNKLPRNERDYTQGEVYEKHCFICGAFHEKDRNSFADRLYAVNLSNTETLRQNKPLRIYKCSECHENEINLKDAMQERDFDEHLEIEEYYARNFNQMSREPLDDKKVRKKIEKYLSSGLFSVEDLEYYSYGNDGYNKCIFCNTSLRYDAGANQISPPVLGVDKFIRGVVCSCHACEVVKSEVYGNFSDRGISVFTEVFGLTCAVSKETFFVDFDEWNAISKIANVASVNQYNESPLFVSNKVARVQWNSNRYLHQTCIFVDESLPGSKECGNNFVIDFLGPENVKTIKNIEGTEEVIYAPAVVNYCSNHRHLAKKIPNNQYELTFEEDNLEGSIDIVIDKFLICTLSHEKCGDDTVYTVFWKLSSAILNSLSPTQIQELLALIPLTVQDGHILEDISTDISQCCFSRGGTNKIQCGCYPDKLKALIDIGRTYEQKINSEALNTFLRNVKIIVEDDDLPF